MQTATIALPADLSSALSGTGEMLLMNEIAEAIRERRVIHMHYEPGARTVEPHAYGISADGNLLLRAYQTAGASASGEHENWKLFRVDRISSLRVSGETFAGPRPGYRQGDSAMKGGVLAQL